MGGQVKEERQRGGVGSADMYKILIGLVVTAFTGLVGFVFTSWTSWTSSTLIDLNSRTAVMESEIKNTNRMVVQNYEMLKFLVSKTQKAGYNDQSWTDVLPSIKTSTEGD